MAEREHLRVITEADRKERFDRESRERAERIDRELRDRADRLAEREVERAEREAERAERQADRKQQIDFQNRMLELLLKAQSNAN